MTKVFVILPSAMVLIVPPALLQRGSVTIQDLAYNGKDSGFILINHGFT
jgi:hypothetical protein